jgi:hypothetical protein
VLEEGIDAGDNSSENGDRPTYNELPEQINLQAEGLEEEDSITNIIRHRTLVLPPINPDTSSENQYNNEEYSEHKKYLDDSLDSKANHNINT